MTRKKFDQELCDAARNFPMLQGVGEEALRELAGLARCHDYPEKNILFYQGDPGGPVFMVLEGHVSIALDNAEGREVVISVVRPGGFFGLISALDGRPQPGNAITATPCRLAKFDGQSLIRWMERQPATQGALLKELGQRVRHAYQKVGEHALMGVKERLLFTLLEIAELEGRMEPGTEAIVFTRPTHLELARRIGSSREVVSRLLKELLEGELLEGEGRVLRVPESALVVPEE